MDAKRASLKKIYRFWTKNYANSRKGKIMPISVRERLNLLFSKEHYDLGLHIEDTFQYHGTNEK
jgi:hypothetical protein